MSHIVIKIIGCFLLSPLCHIYACTQTHTHADTRIHALLTPISPITSMVPTTYSYIVGGQCCACWMQGHKSYKVNKKILYEDNGLSAGLQQDSSVWTKGYHPSLSQVLMALDHLALPSLLAFVLYFPYSLFPPATWRHLKQRTEYIWRAPLLFFPICFLHFFLAPRSCLGWAFTTHWKLSWRSLPPSQNPQSHPCQFLSLFSKINSYERSQWDFL